MKQNLLSLTALCIVCASTLLAEDAASFPKEISDAFNTVPVESRPLVLSRARNGAYYAKLPNGCEMIVMEKHSAPVVAVQGWMRTGGIHEAKWTGAGLSHFCEHMMFKGTTKRPTGVLDKEIRGAGGDDNAYTNSERTVYHITCQSSGFTTSFNVLADMLMDSTFPPEETKKEHSVVYKEIERFLDNAEGVLYETFENLLYQEHPYRIPVLGYPDRFQRVTREEVWAYYQERYSADNCCFVVVGDVDAAKIMPQMAATLVTWKRKSIEPAPIAEEPEQLAPRAATITHHNCNVPKIMLGYPTVALRHPDLYALDLLASILGDGRASRLAREVKDKGLVSDISAFDYTPMYKGFFMVSAMVDGEKVEPARAAIMKVLEDAKAITPTPEELARAKQKVKTSRVLSQMTAEGLAESIGSDWFVAGDLDFSDHYAERMQQVTADDVVRVARKYFAPEKLNTALMLPKQAIAALKNPAAQNNAGGGAAALNEQLALLKGDPAVENVSLLADRAVFEFKLKENGVRVVVREDHSLPAASLAIACLGGLRWESAELNGAGNLLGQMLDRGTPTRSKIKLAEEVENLGASLSGFSGRASFGVTATGLSQDLPKLTALAADCVLNASFPQEEFALLQDETLQQIAGEDEEIVNVTMKALMPLVYGKHPYSRPMLGTVDSVKKITPADLKKLRDEWVHTENLAICFSGDVRAIDALTLVRNSFGTRKAGAFKAPALPPLQPLAKPETREMTRAGIQGAVLMIAFPGADVGSPDREPLDLMAGVLSGLGGRLNTSLRENQGLAYAVGVFNSSQMDGGTIVFYIRTDAKSLIKAEDGMWVEAKLLRNEAAQAKEIESVKNYLVGSEAIELQNQSGVAKNLALSQLYGQGAAQVFARKERLEKISPQALQDAAKKYLDLEKYAKAILKSAEQK